MKLGKIFMLAISQSLAGYPVNVQHCTKLWGGKARQEEGHENRMEYKSC